MESLLTGDNFNNKNEKENEDDLFFVNTFKVENESTKGKTKKKCCWCISVFLYIWIII